MHSSIFEIFADDIFEGLRPDNLPPLTLVDRRDVEAELAGIFARYNNILEGIQETSRNVIEGAAKQFVHFSLPHRLKNTYFCLTGM